MKTKKEIGSILSVLAILVLFSSFALATTVYDNAAYEKTYSAKNIPTGDNPDLMVSVLKYEPYPVIAGDWFDLWVKVQNVGTQSAKNLTIKLVPEYPFSSNDTLTRNFGILFGTINSYQVDQTYDSSQLILKYRIKVADNAPSGSSNIKIVFIQDASTLNSSSTVEDLPIEVFSPNNINVPSQAVQTSNSSNIFYGLIGLITGIFIVILFGLLKHKKKSQAK